LVAANLATYHDEGDANARGSALDQPVHTLDCANRHALVASFLAQNNEGFYNGPGRSLEEPNGAVCAEGSLQSLVAAHMTTFRTGATGHELDEPAKTVTANAHDPGSNPGGCAPMGIVAANLVELHGTAHAEDVEKPLQTISSGGQHHAVVASHIQRDFGQSVGHQSDEPLGCITGNGGGKAGLVASFLQKYYGQGTGQTPDEPMHTIPTVDRFGCVTVNLEGQPHFISDICMRMLHPKELYLAQGFRKGYIIDRGASGKALTKTEQVRMVGNSVSPPLAEALAKANCADLVVRRRVA
jgi:DNA (cytosine-5)-methyltransferase 1